MPLEICVKLTEWVFRMGPLVCFKNFIVAYQTHPAFVRIGPVLVFLIACSFC